MVFAPCFVLTVQRIKAILLPLPNIFASETININSHINSHVHVSFSFPRSPRTGQPDFGFTVENGSPGLSAGQYAVVEWYCDDPGCDCRRAFLQVIPRGQPGPVLASINYGWESRSFYRRKMPYDPDAPRAITEGSLDPLNEQSRCARDALKIFQAVVAGAELRAHLKRHYEMFKATLR